MDCTGICPVGLWRLESFHFADYGIYGKGSGSQHNERADRNGNGESEPDLEPNLYTADFGEFSGVYLAVYALCGSGSIYQKGDRFKASDCRDCCDAVCGRMAGSVCGIPYRHVVWIGG